MRIDGLNRSRQPLRILVIDDDEGVRETLRIMLEDDGMEVMTACDGNEGLGLFETCAVDLVITDLCMPAKNGRETISELRQRRPGIRIIAVSGGIHIRNSSPRDLDKAGSADAVIQKPFDFDELTSQVRALLSGRSGATGATLGSQDVDGSR